MEVVADSDGGGGGLRNSRSDRVMDRNVAKQHQVMDWFIQYVG